MTFKNIARGLRDLALWAEDKLIAGVDEVGRGCIAGPVVAGAVILNPQIFNDIPNGERDLIRDSKLLTQKQRTELIPFLKQISLSWGVGEASAREIETLGILPATFLAMRRALANLTSPHDVILVDGNLKIPDWHHHPQEAIVKGDLLSYHIAAASIFAKEHRDQLMQQHAKDYPGYGFEKHVGYGTKSHIEALTKLGVSALHRRNFAPIKHLPDTASTHR